MYIHGGGFHGKALGFEYTFRAAGFETIWVFDNNPACQAGARRHFPNAQQLGDVFGIHNPRYVDVFTAGFPCQPFSNAGSMMGADDPRYLLPQVIRIISEVKPRVVLLENVPGFRTLDDGYHFRYLLRSLADLGYDAEWGRVRASHVGAPHERKRWCLVAYTSCQRYQESAARNAASDTQRNNTPRQQSRATVQYATVASRQVLGNPNRARLAQRRNGQRKNNSTARKSRANNAPAKSNGSGRLLWGRRNRPTEPSMGRDADGLSAQLDAHRWPAGQGEYQYPYEPPRQISEAPERAERIEALGNAIVPQSFFPLATAIYEWLESQDKKITSDFEL